MPNQKISKNIFRVIIFIIIMALYFGRLFYPDPSLFFTPELGRSDVWHFNYPVKDFLSESLKSGRLPLWNKLAGTGFPFFAEGQIGTFNLSNLALFTLLPTWLAFNISYLIIFSSTFIGTYLFLRKIKIESFASFLSAYIFSFGGFFITHIHHFALVQSASFLPWIFLSALMFWKKQSRKNFLFMVFFVSQQIFSGHFQIFLITMVSLFLFFVFYYSNKKPNEMLRLGLKTLFVLTFSVLLSSIQIIPTLELLSQSVRIGTVSLNDNLALHSIKQLVSLIKPFYLGTPSDGSYPSEILETAGIFWENNAYLGIVPFLIAAYAFLKKNKNRLEKTSITLIIVSLILSFGKNSPFLFIFLFPVFSSLRVPNRFLIIYSFAVSLLVALQFKRSKIFEKNYFSKSIMITLFVVVFIDMYQFGANFHPIAKVEYLLKPPETTELIPQYSRVYTHYSHKQNYFDQFVQNGWKDIDPYIYFRNGLDENSNMIFNYGNIQVYSAIPLLRHFHLEKNLTIGLLNSFSAEYVVATQSLGNYEKFSLIKQIKSESNGLPDYYIYENNDTHSRFRFVSNYEVRDLNFENPDINYYAKEPDFSDKVILEEDLNIIFEKLGEINIRILEDSHTRVVIETKTDKDAILVMADTFYPGWKVKINERLAKIYPANISQRAVVVPAGVNMVEFFYSPLSFYSGTSVSALSLLALIFAGRYFKKIGIG